MDKTTILETRIGGKESGKVLQAAWGDFPPAAQERIIRYGFQRIFNDRVGGSDTGPEEKVAEATAMIERFKAGEVGRQAAAAVDPVTHEARLIVAALLRAKHKDRWAEVKDLEKAERNEALDAIVAKNPAIVEKAKAEVKRKQAEAAKVGALEVTL